jgi:hypothetical protein
MLKMNAKDEAVIRAAARLFFEHGTECIRVLERACEADEAVCDEVAEMAAQLEDWADPRHVG